MYYNSYRHVLHSNYFMLNIEQNKVAAENVSRSSATNGATLTTALRKYN